MNSHPTDDQLRRWHEGTMATVEAAAIEAHLEQCLDGCPGKLDRMSPFDQTTGLTSEDRPCPPNYTRVREIGRGGMGTVILAHDPLLGRDVAIKFLSIAGSPTAGQRSHFWRFRLEGQSMARLHHPNIVAVHKVEKFDDRLFLVMEYVDGGTLEQFRSQQNDPLEAAAMTEKIARAVDYAHTLGVIHRDIKPSNILLTAAPGVVGSDGYGPSVLFRGRHWIPKLADFGLVKIVDESGPGSLVTQVNETMGSPAFMAPERLPGGDGLVGPRTDVHGLGVILFWLLAGQSPFDAATKTEVLRLVRTSPPPAVRRFRSGIPAELEAICTRCLEVDPEDRFATAAEVADRLRAFLNKSKTARSEKSADPDTGVRFETVDSAPAPVQVFELPPLTEPPPLMEPPPLVQPPPMSVEYLAAPDRDRIVVLGRRQSGKTIFLAKLYAQLWRPPRGATLTARALSGEAHKKLMLDNISLGKGQWPPATQGNTRVELELDYHGEKHLMVGLDFAGEIFTRAFLHEQVDGSEARELVDHIDRAAAVLLLVDPSVGFGDDHQAAMEDDFGLVQAVQRIRNWSGGEQVPIAVVLTKMDQYQTLAAEAGGAAELVRRQFPALVRTLGQVVIFQVSAVQTEKGIDGRHVPAMTSVPRGLEQPIKHCLRQIAANQSMAEQERQRHLRRMRQIEEARKQRVLHTIVFSVVAAILLIGAVIGWLVMQDHK